MAFTLGDLFSAGTETTATTIRWAVLFLIHNPKIQEKVYKELENVIGDRPSTMSDKSSLPYFDAFLTEVQRCGNIVPLSLEHAPEQDNTINGFDVPRDAMLIPNLDSALFDPDVFEDPDTFRPERFIDEHGKCSGHEKVIPFCIGVFLRYRMQVPLCHTYKKTYLFW